jgi:energy-coupling factor transporter ATP-binding protein EcfA2
MEEQPLPNWVQELLTLLPACSHFLLSGNVRDVYFAAPHAVDVSAADVDRVLQPLHDVVAGALRTQGVALTVLYDIAEGAVALPRTRGQTDRAQETFGTSLDKLAPRGSLQGLEQLMDKVSNASEPTGLIIKSASRLVRDISQPSDAEFDFYRTVDRIARNSKSSHVADTSRAVYSPIVWVLDNERDVPYWFALQNEFVRSIVLPLPHTGERATLASTLVPLLGVPDEGDCSAGIRVLTEQTAGMTLDAINRTIAIARDQGLGADRVEDAARSYRVGITDNPWRADYLIERLRRETLARGDRLSDTPTPSDSEPPTTQPSMLASRVLGQDAAVSKALDILVRSATGLTAAQAGPATTRPRGVLFFAGPTGVGKTELAKALTKLLFDDERFYIRFDMSEFAAEQAADRLIGSPPGYVGYDAGGELTNAIRQRPFSLVLFDEIEKAHPRILDKFLQLLDDGRLTDGRGETVFFTEAVIVFTSNLGVYADIEETAADGRTARRRVQVVNRKTMDREEIAERIRQTVRDFFTLQIGRPELLNRIGDNIVVFDFIDQPTGARILDLMLANVIARVRQEHHCVIEFPAETVSLLREVCLDEKMLELGGRGIGSMLETCVINPLANRLFIQALEAGARVAVRVEQRGGQWVAHLS